MGDTVHMGEAVTMRVEQRLLMRHRLGVFLQNVIPATS